MSPELPPCPFCGHEAYFLEGDYADTPWKPACSNRDCGCDFVWYPTKEKATEAWSRRCISGAATDDVMAWVADLIADGGEMVYARSAKDQSFRIDVKTLAAFMKENGAE